MRIIKDYAMALGSGKPVMPVFIFDDNIIDELPQDDARLSFIYSKLEEINDFLLIQTKLHKNL